jgi:hypothetical protein
MMAWEAQQGQFSKRTIKRSPSNTGTSELTLESARQCACQGDQYPADQTVSSVGFVFANPISVRLQALGCVPILCAQSGHIVTGHFRTSPADPPQRVTQNCRIVLSVGPGTCLASSSSAADIESGCLPISNPVLGSSAMPGFRRRGFIGCRLQLPAAWPWVRWPATI